MEKCMEKRMEKMSRRELVIALSSFAALGGVASMAHAQSEKSPAENAGKKTSGLAK